MASALVYLAILLVTVYKVLRDLRKKQNELLSLSPVLRPNVTNMFNGLRFFLVLTLLVAVCSIVTAVLPAEVLLHHLQHDQNEYNIYSELGGSWGLKERVGGEGGTGSYSYMSSDAVDTSLIN